MIDKMAFTACFMVFCCSVFAGEYSQNSDGYFTYDINFTPKEYCLGSDELDFFRSQAPEYSEFDFGIAGQYHGQWYGGHVYGYSNYTPYDPNWRGGEPRYHEFGYEVKLWNPHVECQHLELPEGHEYYGSSSLVDSDIYFKELDVTNETDDYISVVVVESNIERGASGVDPRADFEVGYTSGGLSRYAAFYYFSFDTFDWELVHREPLNPSSGEPNTIPSGRTFRKVSGSSSVPYDTLVQLRIEIKKTEIASPMNDAARGFSLKYLRFSTEIFAGL